MPMTMKGLAKLVEECGELTQIAAKKMARMDTDEHWDNQGPLLRRLEDELADVAAISTFVFQKFNLSASRIKERSALKLALFQKWDRE